MISMYLFPRRDSTGNRPVRSDAADSSRETVRMKGRQSREVGSKESHREGWRNKERIVQGKVDTVNNHK